MNDKNNGIWYRVWNEETKSWVYGVPMYTKDELRVYTDPYNNPEKYVSLPLVSEVFRYLEELPNGQSLYCGDIVKVTEYLGTYSFSDYYLFEKNGDFDRLNPFYNYDEGFINPNKKFKKEVIGNIIENKHLLEPHQKKGLLKAMRRSSKL